MLGCEILVTIYGVLIVGAVFKWMFTEKKEKIYESKPIFVVILPIDTLMEDCDYVRRNMCDLLKDYHVLVTVGRAEQTAYRCFYEKDFNKVKYDELKEIIKDTFV